MNIVTPYWYIRPLPFQVAFDLKSGIELLRQVEFYARISHRSEEAVTPDSWGRIIQSVVLQHGDWSVTEHEKVTVLVEVDRGITHEWVRHRLGAYTQESTRFVNYEKKIPARFINPFRMPGIEATEEVHKKWEHVIETCEFAYKALLDFGATPQIARSVLPNALAAMMAVTYNLRMWRHFFLMRTTLETHPQFKQITIPMLAKFKEVIPLLYDDIEPNQRQAHNLRLPE